MGLPSRLLASYSYKAITDSIVNTWLLVLTDRICMSVRVAASWGVRAGQRIAWALTSNCESKLHGISEHAHLTAFDYNVFVPPDGFKPEPGKHAIWLEGKPGESLRLRTRNYTNYKGRVLHRYGWLNNACKLHFMDFGLQAAATGPTGKYIVQYPDIEPARVTAGGAKNFKILAQQVGSAYAEKLANDIGDILVKRGFDVEIFGPAVITFRR